MKYLLTGATGFIGGRLAQQLREAGHEVIALVRGPQKAKHLQAIGVQLAAGDITDKASLPAPMTGVDGVFHVAGWYKIGVRSTDAGVTYWGANSKARRELGYDPRPLAEGLRATLLYDLRELEIQPPASRTIE